YEKGGVNFPLITAQLALDNKVMPYDKTYKKQISFLTYLKNIFRGEGINFSHTKYRPYLSDPIARLFQIMNW
ncbi:MAG: hypothetical protein RL728_1162, partial [Bacteroidota bacterium]